MFDLLNAIDKERRQKVSNTHDFLGSIHSREMTTTRVTVTCIKHLLKFNMSGTMTKDNVDTAMIKIVTNEEIARGLMLNMSLIIMSNMGDDFLGLKIGEDISLPKIIRGYSEQMFI